MSTVNKFQIDVLRNYVFPEIEKSLDLEKIQFHFIGANHYDLPEDFKKKKYIIGRGYVNDLSFEIKDSDIFFCVTPKPLGFRTRICEALSLGACILTSKYDQASMPFLEDKNLFLFDILGISPISICPPVDKRDREESRKLKILPSLKIYWKTL